MEIEVSTRHQPVAEDLRAYAHKKAERLLRYFNLIQRIRVVLDVRGEGACCEIIAEIEHAPDCVAQECSNDMRASIDAALDKLERQLVQHKDRVRDRKGRGPNPHQPTVV